MPYKQFNDFVKWSFFGGDGIIAENIRHEQRKVIKYNHLVANMIILHNLSAHATELIDDLDKLRGKRLNASELDT